MSPEPVLPKNSLVVRRGTFLVFLAIVTAAFFQLIGELLMACFWAAILAIIFHGVNDWFLKKNSGRANWASLGTMVVILLVVIIPLFLVTLAVIGESSTLVEALNSGTINPEGMVNSLKKMIPVIEQFFAKFGVPSDQIDERISTFSAELLQSLGSRAVQTTQNAMNFIVLFSLMLYLLFFFIRDGNSIVESIKKTLPIGDEIEEKIFNKFAQVSRATLKGTLIVAIIQGSIGGLAFAALGIPGATLWGVIMILLSLLPVGGSMFVWVPAAIILFANGDTGKALILVVIGALFIGLIDNLLRPLLVGRDTKMPDYLVLLATLGGLAQFGLTGFIIGPVIAALFLTCWEITGTLFGGSER
jgi:predicted PurR-regulated permease PerM